MTDPAIPRGNAQKPLIGPEVDLRDFGYMALDVVRLRDSSFTATTSAEGFRAGVLLWCASWHQIPAASLPTDDRVLARLAGFGRDVDGWLTVKEEALHRYVLCDDGRLYHPVVAEKALDAWTLKQARKARTAEATAARQAKRKAAEVGPIPPDFDNKRHDQRDVQRDEKRHDQRDVHQGKGKEGKGSEEKDREASLRSAGAPAAPASAPKRPKACRVEANWAPDLVDREYASSQGLSAAETQHEAEQFRDHWLQKAGSDGLKSDWRAAWRTWCRNAVKFRDRDRTRDQQRSTASRGRPHFDPMAFAAEHIAMMEDDDV